MSRPITDIRTGPKLLTAHYALVRVLRGTFVRGRVPGCEDDIVDRCADPVYREKHHHENVEGLAVDVRLAGRNPVAPVSVFAKAVSSTGAVTFLLFASITRTDETVRARLGSSAWAG